VHESVLQVGAVDVCCCVREFVDHSHERRVIWATGDVANPSASMVVTRAGTSVARNSLTVAILLILRGSVDRKLRLNIVFSKFCQ
jgi:hypothetical protein